MEILDERVSYQDFLDQLPQPICSGHLLINCYHERLLEIYGDEKMILNIYLLRSYALYFIFVKINLKYE